MAKAVLIVADWLAPEVAFKTLAVAGFTRNVPVVTAVTPVAATVIEVVWAS